jgi:hypothetical protein
LKDEGMRREKKKLKRKIHIEVSEQKRRKKKVYCVHYSIFAHIFDVQSIGNKSESIFWQKREVENYIYQNI